MQLCRDAVPTLPRERVKFGELLRGQGAVEDGDAADPAGEADATGAMDDATDGEGAAGAVVLGLIEVVRIPPRVET